MKHIEGITFPASKSDIIDRARGGDGSDSDQVLSVLQQIDD